MMLYIETKQGRIIGPFPQEIAERSLQEFPGAILITESMRKSILRNMEAVRRENRQFNRGL